MKKELIFSLVALGIISVISQTIIIRELTMTFWGNEFFIGLILALWLLFTAAGASFKKKNPKLLYILSGVFLLSEFLLIRYMGQNIVLGVLVLFPLCFVLGLWFKSKVKPENVAKAYFLEMIGFVIGGIIITIVLIYSQQIIDSVPYLKQIDNITASWRFKNQELVKSVNSPFGNIAVTKTDDQLNFYGNGLLLGSEDEFEFSEKLIHLTLLQHENPKDILLIGGGFSGVFREILKHAPERIIYVEPDPKITDLIQTPENVQIINQDAYYYLNNTQEQFDAIIINLPNPSTALMNRFYTKEFFEKAKNNLKSKGILTTYLSYTESSASNNLQILHSVIINTLSSSFAKTLAVKEETGFFFAGAVEENPEILIKRLKQRNIKTSFLNEQYINYLFLRKQESNPKAQINKNLHPVAYFFQTLFWLDMFNTNLSKIFKKTAENFWIIFLALLIILTILYKHKTKPIFSVAAAGFSLMAFETISIFVFQTAIGHLFVRIALLISALTLGMVLGVWYGQKTKKGILIFHFLIIILSLACYFIFVNLAKEPVILIISLIAGFLGGAIFPIANKMYLERQKEPDKKTGTIYAADLIGACLGAVIPSLILIPVFGLFETLIFIAVLNLWIMLMF
ncbi:hypothetical protein AMJ47_00625 [Parcubacteria bacterium DG_72]|nr:MAG: hypothetical protein AMJ47_00625 [Parcubacteria bacterium DG_72]